MRESGLQQYVVSEIRRRGGYAVTACPPVEAGTPDVLACVNGRFVGIECKVRGAQPSKLQTHRIKQIQAARGIAAVIRSRRELRELLSGLA